MAFLRNLTKLYVYKNFIEELPEVRFFSNISVVVNIFLNTILISSNNSKGRLFLFSYQKVMIIQGKAIIRRRRLFQIFLTRGHALNILFYYTIKKWNTLTLP